MSDQEKMLAIQEGYRIHYCDAYFYVRPQIDCGDRRKVFDAGFDRGWEAASIKSDAEIAKRDAIIAMQVEALNLYAKAGVGNSTDFTIQFESNVKGRHALSASAESVAAWEAEHAAKVLEEAANQFEEEDEQFRIDENMQHTYATRLRRMATELRAKSAQKDKP